MVVVRRTYIPKPGGGSELINHLKDVSSATVQAGFPPLIIHRKLLGLHGTVVTDQRWTSMDEYQQSRGMVTQNGSITDVFKRIYPCLSSTHETELYEIMD